MTTVDPANAPGPSSNGLGYSDGPVAPPSLKGKEKGDLEIKIEFG